MMNAQEACAFRCAWSTLCMDMMTMLFQKSSGGVWTTRMVNVVPNLGFKVDNPSLENDERSLYMFDDTSYTPLVVPPKIQKWCNALSVYHGSSMYEQLSVTFTRTPVGTIYVQAMCVSILTGLTKRIVSDVIKV